MESLKFVLVPIKVRVAAAVFALLCSLCTLAAVFIAFASISDGLDPRLQPMATEPSASAVASKAPAKRLRT